MAAKKKIKSSAGSASKAPRATKAAPRAGKAESATKAAPRAGKAESSTKAAPRATKADGERKAGPRGAKSESAAKAVPRATKDGSAASAASRARKPKPAAGTLKVATFNVNGVRGRLPQLLEWLGKESPDIVCLQELKADSFPKAELESAGYGAIWNAQRSWNGVAILAKGTQPIEVRRQLPGTPRDDTQSRYLEAAVHGVLIAGVYLPNGNPQPGPKFDYKLAWFERLISHAQSLYESGHPVALIGDFNVVPTDFDIYNPRSWLKDALLQPESRECFRRLVGQGWEDVLRSRFPDQQIFTFWDYFRQHWQRNAGLRIDHLLVNPELAPRVKDAGVDTWVRGAPHASDHAPAWMTLARS